MNTTENTEMTAEYFAALCKDVGLIEAIRVYQEMGLGSGDYTRDRHQWLDNITEEDIEREWNAMVSDDQTHSR